MGKHTKLVLLLCLAQAFLIAPPLFARALEDSDYTVTVEKIYKRIDTITFSFEGSTLTYAVILAARFENLNATHVRLRLNLFINTVDDNYVTNMDVNCSFIANFTINGNLYQRTGWASDSTGFMQYGKDLYNYDLCTVEVLPNFPASVSIGFNYGISSDGGELSKTGNTSVSGFFLGPTIWTVIVVGIIAGIACAIIFGVRAAKRRGGVGAGGGGKYKADYKIRSVSSKDIREYERQFQAEKAAKEEEQARARAEAEARARTSGIQRVPASSGMPVQAGVPGSAIAMASSQGTPAPGAPSATTCPACGGNIVNFKCQSCWGKVCRGCGHLNMATSFACEKCNRTL